MCWCTTGPHVLYTGVGQQFQTWCTWAGTRRCTWAGTMRCTGAGTRCIAVVGAGGSRGTNRATAPVTLW